jgi:3-oxoacyl-[acyl-carrier protein] reductase
VDLQIAGKVALVTGGGSGIGEAVALALAAEGVRLAVAARRQARVDDVARRAQAAGAASAAGFSFDQADRGSVAGLLRDVTAHFGSIEILIVNGGGPKPGTFTQVGEDDWDAAYALTMKSALRLVEGVLPAMRERRWGRIVALESTSVKQPIANLVLSNAFRTGVVAALKTLSAEVAAEGITINCIATGRVLTERLTALYGAGTDGARLAAAGVPMGRPASPEEFAPLVAFLCGEPARYVTGQTIAIDGGLIAGVFG